MPVLALSLAALAFALLALPAGRRWRSFAARGNRLRAHFEAVRFTLALSAAVVSAILAVLMATGRFA